MRASKTVVMAFVCCAAALPVAAQTPSANPVSDSVRQSWAEAKRDIQGSAAQMPEVNYSFKPVPSVQSFGAILAHVAGSAFEFCAAAKNEAPPHKEDEFEKSATTKAAIDKAVSDAIAYCDSAYTALTDRSAAEMANQAFGTGKAPRVSALVGNVSHFMEHYGNLVTYFRIKGMVPPSSRPAN